MDTRDDTTSFSSVDQTANPDFFIRFVDAANTVKDIQRLKQRILAMLDLQPGHQALDVGCGTGDDVQAMAQLVGEQGRVVGLDHSQVMIGEARARVAGKRLPLEFLLGDAEHLGFPDAAFDRCRSERTLMHLEAPQAALSEMARVLRSGGKLVVFDFDWDAMVIDHPDKELTRRIVRVYSDSIRHGWIGRQLSRLMHESGLRDVTIMPHSILPSFQGLQLLLRGCLSAAQAAGMLSGEEIAGWWQYLEQANAADRFFAGYLGFIVRGSKP